MPIVLYFYFIHIKIVLLSTILIKNVYSIIIKKVLNLNYRHPDTIITRRCRRVKGYSEKTLQITPKAACGRTE